MNITPPKFVSYLLYTIACLLLGVAVCVGCATSQDKLDRQQLDEAYEAGAITDEEYASQSAVLAAKPVSRWASDPVGQTTQWLIDAGLVAYLGYRAKTGKKRYSKVAKEVVEAKVAPEVVKS